MASIIYRVAVYAFSLLMLSQAYAQSDNRTFFRDYWHPKFHCVRLNYCNADGSECGLPIANQYCQMMGYKRASYQIIANNVGLTNVLFTRIRCKGWQCNGFKMIRCANDFTHKPAKAYHYRLRRFVLPRYNKYRVAWCYDGQKDCGRRAANSFCRRLGYLKARSFGIETAVPATKAIGNQKLCFGYECNAFSHIDCFR